MNKHQKSFINDSPRFLMHYNPNHDKLGRFASGSGISSKTSTKRMSISDRFFDAINKRDERKREKEYNKYLKEQGVSEKDLQNVKDVIEKDEKLKKINKDLEIEIDKVFRGSGGKLDYRKYVDAAENRRDEIIKEYNKKRSNDNSYDLAKEIFDSLNASEKRNLTSNGDY